MTKDPEVCEYGKKYPCCDCEDPCPEELKRRAFYEEHLTPEDEDDWAEVEAEENDPENW